MIIEITFFDDICALHIFIYLAFDKRLAAACSDIDIFTGVKVTTSFTPYFHYIFTLIIVSKGAISPHIDFFLCWHFLRFDLSGRTRFAIWIFNFKAPLLNEHSIGIIIFLFEWKIKKYTCIFFFFQTNEWKLCKFFYTCAGWLLKKQSVNRFKCHLGCWIINKWNCFITQRYFLAFCCSG